ncbi:hypothetical protein FNF27_05804 [Cafeteria roenbergensis]|uniref:Peptidase M16 N-terminal domain-containing protein n=1 Tax=Cafeteria roenbergensis TaxID=33653 RepID=A0A5A8E6I3_CAFRO|nr:hypothetical protein FNF27_05804 [Cafeteria roenbergensis]
MGSRADDDASASGANESDSLMGEEEGQRAGSEAAKGSSGNAAQASASWFYTLIAVAGVVLLSLIVVSLAVHTTTSAQHSESDTVVVSPNDERAFTVVTLTNGLQTLLVSDPEADKAAAAADVGSGSWKDPPTVEGLAHFTEHMLFLGTVRFPEPDGYQRYLSAHGGFSNAYTDSEHTNYYFAVDWRHLRGALKQFAEFFVAPLLAPEAAAKEMLAIESEHHKNLQEDAWRLQQLLRTAGLPGTPVSRFSTGNLATLNKTNIDEELLRFHSAHYVAANMRAALLGRESLEELHQLAEETFGQVPASADEVDARRAQAESDAAAAAKQKNDRRDKLQSRGAAAASAPVSARRSLQSRKPAAGAALDATSSASSAAGAAAAALLQAAAADRGTAQRSRRRLTAEPAPKRRDPPAEAPAASAGTEEAAGAAGAPAPAPKKDSPAPAPAGGDAPKDPSGQEPAGGADAGAPAPAATGAVTDEAVRAAAQEALKAEEAIAANVAKGLPAAGAEVQVGDRWTAADLDPSVIFPAGRLGRIIRWRPVGDGNTVKFVFPLPAQKQNYLAAPTSHLSVLLGDESEGSILLNIKRDLGIAEDLVAGLEMDNSGFSLFNIGVTLSPAAGETSADVDKAVAAVGNAIFAYLAMLRGPAPGETRNTTRGAPAPTTALASTRWLWDERRSVAEADFLFPTRSKSSDLVSGAARSLHDRAPADLLSPPARWRWDAAQLNATISLLTPQRCIVVVGSRAFADAELPDSEPIYGTRHSSKPIPPATMKAWTAPSPVAALSLPRRNPFVPKDLSVLPLGWGVTAFDPNEPYTPVPEALSDLDLDARPNPGEIGQAAKKPTDDAPEPPVPGSAGGQVRFRRVSAGEPEAAQVSDDATAKLAAAAAAEAKATKAIEAKAGFPQGKPPLPASGISVWWRQDETFRKPVVNVMLEVETPVVVRDARASVYSTLYLSSVDDTLQAEAYRAQTAGYVYAATKAGLVSGISVVAGGFSEAMPLWLTTVMGGVRSPKLDAKRFEAHLGLLKQSLDNNEKTSKPYARALYFYKTFIGENAFTIPELRVAVANATLEGLQAHAEEMWKAARVVMLVHGNVNATGAATLARIVARSAAGTQPLTEQAATASRRAVRWVRGNRMIQRRVSNPAEGDSAVAVLHQLGLLEDCFAGLTPAKNASASAAVAGAGAQLAAAANATNDAASMLQRAGRRRLRQAPRREGVPSKARGPDGDAAHSEALENQHAPEKAAHLAELVRRRECTVRELAAQLLGDALYQPAFEELRTKQQLGYLVFAGLTSSPTLGAEEPHTASAAAGGAPRPALAGGALVHGTAPAPAPRISEAVALAAPPLPVRGDEMQALYVIVQGPDNSPALLDVRVTQFLATVNETLAKLARATEEGGSAATTVWDGMVTAQTIAKRRKPLSLSEGTGAMWGEISGRTFRFERKKDQIEVLANGHIAMSDVVSLYNSRVLDMEGGAGRMSVQVFGADVPFTSPTQAWQADALVNSEVAGPLPSASAAAVNVTDADPINSRLN